MRVLSVKQPWAHMLIDGTKPFEIRTWKTDYRGRIALHASSGTVADALERGVEDDAWAECFARSALVTAQDVKALQRSAIIGTIEIAEIGTLDDLEDSMSDAELDLFDEVDGDHFLWRMTKPLRIAPLSIDGKLNLWTLPDDVAAEVAKRESAARVRSVSTSSAVDIERAKSRWSEIRTQHDKDLDAFLAAPVRIGGPLSDFMSAQRSTRAEIYHKLESRCASLPSTDDGRTVLDAPLRAIVGGRNKYMALHDIVQGSLRWIE